MRRTSFIATCAWPLGFNIEAVEFQNSAHLFASSFARAAASGDRLLVVSTTA